MWERERQKKYAKSQHFIIVPILHNHDWFSYIKKRRKNEEEKRWNKREVTTQLNLFQISSSSHYFSSTLLPVWKYPKPICGYRCWLSIEKKNDLNRNAAYPQLIFIYFFLLGCWFCFFYFWEGLKATIDSRTAEQSKTLKNSMKPLEGITLIATIKLKAQANFS